MKCIYPLTSAIRFVIFNLKDANFNGRNDMTERAIYQEQDDARALFIDQQITSAEYMAFMQKANRKLKKIRLH